MINVVIWLGKIKYSADLAIVFARNNIRIVDENFENTDDFIDRFDSLDANVDVLVIADALLLGADRKKLFQRIRQCIPGIPQSVYRRPDIRIQECVRHIRHHIRGQPT